MCVFSNAATNSGFNATLSQFGKTDVPKVIMEVGFGQGAFSILLAQQFPQAVVVGIDAHALSVHTAQQILDKMGSAAPVNVRFEGVLL